MAEDEIIKKHTEAVYTAWKDPQKKWVQQTEGHPAGSTDHCFCGKRFLSGFMAGQRSAKNTKKKKNFIRG